MHNDINELDVNDIGLKQIMGDRFHDETTEKPTAVKVTPNTSNTTRTAKAAQKPNSRPTNDKERQPERYELSFTQKLMACAKTAGVYAALSLLFFYWQQSGQMEPSAAVPSMCACTAMVGYTYGKVFAKECRR
jgi:hypothetical protein